MARVIDRWKWACTVAAPRLTGTQRAVLHVLIAHAPNGSTIVGQDTMAESAGITDRALRPVLGALESIGLIAAERRPGKTTVWTVNTDWTPEADFRAERPRKGTGPRKPASAPSKVDPGSTPEVPRNSTSDGSGSERTPLSLPTEVRDVREGEVIDITKSLAAALSMDRKAATA